MNLNDNEKYVFYDETYLAPGYFIVFKKDSEIEKFMKFYIMNEYGFPCFGVRAFCVGAKDQCEQKFNKIEFHFDSVYDNLVYPLFLSLYNSLSSKKITSIDKDRHGNNYFELFKVKNQIMLEFAKDVYHGSQHPTDFFDIIIGDDYSCEEYLAFFTFYQNLAKLATKNINHESILKLILTKSKL